MSIHGVCKKLHTGNEPQYASKEFSDFAAEWDFIHITSSPRYPQSNGFAERMVGVVKGILKKAKQAGTDPNIALMCYRATPATDQESPAELLFKRKIQANLPVRQLRADADVKLVMKKTDHTLNGDKYQRGAKELSTLIPGMKVLARRDDDNSWEPATVVELCDEPRSYIIESPNGQQKRRNRKFLKEITHNAARKLCFKRVSFADDDEDPGGPPTPESADPPQTETTPRRSGRIRRQPQRYGWE
jgi:transposase InsO family protein